MNDSLRRQTARETGICMDCPAPVDGKRGFAIRCTECRRLADRGAGRRCYAGKQPEVKAERASRAGERVAGAIFRGLPFEHLTRSRDEATKNAAYGDPAVRRMYQDIARAAEREITSRRAGLAGAA